jgi:inorganic pyrophosphatase
MPADPPSPLAQPFLHLPATGRRARQIHAFVDTPKGSRHKYKFDETLGLFRLERVLGAGLSFPYNFGYIPSTRGEDGDPLDVLLLMDEPCFVGCLVAARLIGVIEAQQVEAGATHPERNDRLLAVADQAPTAARLTHISQVNPTVLDEIEAFFIAYTSQEGKRFTPQRRSGPARALQLLAQGMRAFENQS